MNQQSQQPLASEVQLMADSGCVTSVLETVDNGLSKKPAKETISTKSKAELRAERRQLQVSKMHLVLLPRCMKCRRGLAMRILSVRPSVRLSVTRVYCDKMEERSVQIFIPYERTFSLVF